MKLSKVKFAYLRSLSKRPQNYAIGNPELLAMERDGLIRRGSIENNKRLCWITVAGRAMLAAAPSEQGGDRG